MSRVNSEIENSDENRRHTVEEAFLIAREMVLFGITESRQCFRMDFSDSLPRLNAQEKHLLVQLLNDLLSFFMILAKKADIHISCIHADHELLFKIAKSGMISFSEDDSSLDDPSLQHLLDKSGYQVRKMGGSLQLNIGEASEHNVVVRLPIGSVENISSHSENGHEMWERWTRNFNHLEDVQEIIRKSLENLAGEIEIVKGNLMEGEYDGLAERIHSMKGFPGGFGLTDLYEKLVTLEDAVHESPVNFEKAILQIDALEELLESIPALSEIKRGGAGEKQPEIKWKDDSPERKGSVLIAEDDMMNQDLFKYVLNRLGYFYEAVNNGREALDALERNKYDLLLIDIQMPEIGGMDAIRMIQSGRRHREMPIIVTSAYSQVNASEEDRKLKFDEFISKPIDIDELVVKIERQMARRS